MLGLARQAYIGINIIDIDVGEGSLGGRQTGIAVVSCSRKRSNISEIARGNSAAIGIIRNKRTIPPSLYGSSVIGSRVGPGVTSGQAFQVQSRETTLLLGFQDGNDKFNLLKLIMVYFY